MPQNDCRAGRCTARARELSVFGSAARGEMRLDSDIDLLVDFLPEARPGLLGLWPMLA